MGGNVLSPLLSIVYPASTQVASQNNFQQTDFSGHMNDKQCGPV